MVNPMDFYSGQAPDGERTSAAGWLFDIALAVAVAAFCWIMTSLATNAPHARAVAGLQAAAEIDAENHAFCGKLNLLPKSGPFVTCIRELARVRRSHEERLNRDWAAF